MMFLTCQHKALILHQSHYTTVEYRLHKERPSTHHIKFSSLPLIHRQHIQQQVTNDPTQYWTGLLCASACLFAQEEIRETNLLK